MMTEIYKYSLDQLKKHGLPMIMLAIAVLYFHNRQVALEAKIESCNDEIIEIYKEREERIIAVIQANTMAWERVALKLEGL